MSSPEGIIHYEYDPATGRKTRTWTANNDIRYAYDELGRLLTVSVYMANAVSYDPPLVTAYDYTAVGSRAAVLL